MDVTVGHASGAPAIPTTSAAVDVSFDGGQTWTPAGLTDRGGGTYRAAWTNPATGNLSIRLRAADADGATLTQSVLDVARIG